MEFNIKEKLQIGTSISKEVADSIVRLGVGDCRERLIRIFKNGQTIEEARAIAEQIAAENPGQRFALITRETVLCVKEIIEDV